MSTQPIRQTCFLKSMQAMIVATSPLLLTGCLKTPAPAVAKPVAEAQPTMEIEPFNSTQVLKITTPLVIAAPEQSGFYTCYGRMDIRYVHETNPAWGRDAFSMYYVCNNG